MLLTAVRTNLSTEALARGSARRPWTIVLLWIAALIAAAALVSVFLGSALTTEDSFTNDPEAIRAAKLVDERGSNGGPRATDFVIVRSPTHTVDDAAFQAFVTKLHGELAALGKDTVTVGPHYYISQQPAQVSADRATTLLPLFSIKDFSRIEEVLDDAGHAADFEVLISGQHTFSRDFEHVSQEDLDVELKMGLPAAFVVLLLVFGALVAAIVPVVLAFVAIALALGATALIGQAAEFSFFVTNMIFMMGLAVGVDYSLFIVSRYREERARGLEKADAIAAAGATAGRAVFFSGLVVVLSLGGLLIVPTSVFRSLGGDAILVVIASLLASLTLLPALLSLLGDRVNALRIPFLGRPTTDRGGERRGRFWDVITGAVIRRPVFSLLLTVAVLLAAAAPTLGLKTGQPGISTFPDGLRSKDGYVALEQAFSYGLVSPASVVIDGAANSPAVQQGVSRLQAALAADGRFGPSRFVANDAGDLGVLTVPVNGDPSSEAAVAAVRQLRSDYVPAAFAGVPAEVLVGGQTAGNIDFFDLTDRYLPIVLTLVLGLSFLLLTVVFRSLVVPIKAILMNLLSVGVAYGLLVLVFQYGIGNELLGFQQAESVAAWIPLFLFSILFGLSMDYHVFLLSRVRERYDQTGDNSEAVAYGVRSTAALITGAALIMVAVFSGFAMGQLIMFQQIGFGLAVAVLLDATIVRSVLVPATMQLLGRRNWYLPRFLKWLPQVSVEGESSAPRVPASHGTLELEPVPVRVDD
ncbi:MAG: MMPL domain-containing protein [Dehalococcoidia bacterium]|nr:MMPL domain-containing protein [Dehalococcoidia bacterium]